MRGQRVRQHVKPFKVHSWNHQASGAAHESARPSCSRDWSSTRDRAYGTFSSDTVVSRIAIDEGAETSLN